MKKIILSSLLAISVSMSSFAASRDLIGVYVRISQQSFYCAMISTRICARVSDPDTGGGDGDTPWKHQFRCYNPNGDVIDAFEASNYTISETANGTMVEYLP